MEIEKWKSQLGNREDHYYVGRDHKVYLFGINPKMVSRTTIEKIQKLILSDETFLAKTK